MTFDEALPVLIAVGRQFGFRPDLPIGMQDFFIELLAGFSSDREVLPTWLDAQAAKYFPCMVDRPNWLQEPEWPLRNGRPMLFVGQIDRSVGEMTVSFYVFKDIEIGITKVVTQVLATV